MTHLRRAPRLLSRAGFTLIELLAVILIIGILATFLLPKIPEAIDQAKVTGCAKNQSEFFNGLTLYQTKFKGLPDRENSGARFLAVLVASKTWENDKGSVEKLNCPGVDMNQIGPPDVPQEEWYVDLDLVDGSYTSYAGRDTMSFPLRKLSSKEPLIACDNDGGMNHRTTTNVLYGGGRVESMELFTLIEEGILTEDEEHLVVGPESPVEDLQKLSLD